VSLRILYSYVSTEIRLIRDLLIGQILKTLGAYSRLIEILLELGDRAIQVPERADIVIALFGA